jgi:hypothetical protein
LREGEQRAGDRERGEREGKLEKEPDKERRLERGVEWEVARRQYALEMLLEDKGERRSKGKERHQTTGRRRPTERPDDEARHSQQHYEHAEDGGERAVRQVGVSCLRKGGAALVGMRDDEPVRDFVRTEPACNGEGE